MKRGSAAYDYAIKSNYKFEIPDETFEQAAAQILKEKAEPAPNDWEQGDFTGYGVRRYWHLTNAIKAGKYRLEFVWTGGLNALYLTDALFVADGKPIEYFPTKFNKAFIINIPEDAKKLELYAIATTGNLPSSEGYIEMRTYRY